MSVKENLQDALPRVVDQQSFFKVLLGSTLDWPTQDVDRIEDIAYGWTGNDLRAADLNRTLLDGSVWQIQPAVTSQPWGIFVLRFNRPDLLSPHQGMAGTLRAVLRGLVGSRRKDAQLPSWRREHLLFVCTHDWQSYRFCYFHPRPDDPKSARLTTFGWSPGTSNRTVCEFNLPALVWPEDTADAPGWVEKWSQAFDKEPLTKDFFRRFDVALDSIKSDLEVFQGMPSTAAYTQSQLLLERLIFIYFLQNRGWLDQTRTYLRDRLIDHVSKPSAFSYYAEFLDKLFWTLSSAPGEGGRLPGIPFLNGGLFDDDDFRQLGDQRRANPPLKVRNSTLQIVFRDLLEAFNFTVTEDTPLNEEVAVDPEMLGKVFESIVLHAEAADPDAVAPDKRKATGSYYTPRIVVHFICREVLYQYLHARLPGEEWAVRLRSLLEMDASDIFDEATREYLKAIISPDQAAQLRDIVVSLRCCDPAVGSGAFPVGLLHELVNFRRLLVTAANGYVDPVRREGSGWLHDTKEAIVQHCLFGVDIQQQAIEICRLRLWLSLIVDYDIGLDPFTAERGQFASAIQRISQLPNLEMNFHRGDSLHDYVCGVPIVILRNRASSYSLELRAISKLGQDLHNAKRADRKKELRLAILDRRLDLSSRLISDELRSFRTQDSALDSLFDLAASTTKKRERLTSEIQHLESAFRKVEEDREKLGKLKRRAFDGQFYHKLRKLEGADFDSPFNFAWTVDFPGIFGPDKAPGFDIIVGNPPFVTARNPTRRELYRQRWPLVCYKNYLLVCPFFELSFGLLRPEGQLGFIVSNAFAKRDFGKPIIERFFPTVNLQKIIDCSGLMFPGHGTPTCLVFGRQPSHVARTMGSAKLGSLDSLDWKRRAIRVAAILPGGGDLRNTPEQSPLWATLSSRHDEPGFSSAQVVVCDRSREEMAKWPWSFIPDAPPETGSPSNAVDHRLRDLCAEPIGAQFITGKDEAFIQPAHYFRRTGIPIQFIRAYGTGEDVRNWTFRPSAWIIFPYDKKLRPLKEPLGATLSRHLRPLKDILENSIISGSTKKKETKLKWFEFRRLARAKFEAQVNVIIPQIATHAHFVVADHGIAFKEKAQAIVFNQSLEEVPRFAVLGLLNSSLMLERLKQDCFNKGAGSEEEKDRYEFSGGKLEDIRLPEFLASALIGQLDDQARQLARLAQLCTEQGQNMCSLDLKKLFEKADEAYVQWNSELPDYIVGPHASTCPAFETAEDLLESYNRFRTQHSKLRLQMIALQEEMDWLVYSACGLLPVGHPATRVDMDPAPLDRDQRPFCMFARAIDLSVTPEQLIPPEWEPARKGLWAARLAVLREAERVRRVEQPVNKRRWDEQWKIGAQWQCGRLAYAAEFIDAFEWWVREKAEWWLEYRSNDASAGIDKWVRVLWSDPRIRAAWTVAAGEYSLLSTDKTRVRTLEGFPLFDLEDPAGGAVSSFKKAFKRIVDEETIPEGIPSATPYEELEAQREGKISAKVKSLRGKLNVPRERFHLRGSEEYLWAGLQFKVKCASGKPA